MELQCHGRWRSAQQGVETIVQFTQARLQRSRRQWEKALVRRASVARHVREDDESSSEVMRGLLKRKRESVSSLEAAHQLFLSLSEEARNADDCVQDALHGYTQRTCDWLEKQNQEKSELLKLLFGSADVYQQILSLRNLTVAQLLCFGSASRACRAAVQDSLRSAPRMILLMNPTLKARSATISQLYVVTAGSWRPAALRSPEGARQLCAPMLLQDDLCVLGAMQTGPSESYIACFRSLKSGWAEMSREDAALTLSRVTMVQKAIHAPRAWEWDKHLRMPRRVLAASVSDERVETASWPQDAAEARILPRGHTVQGLGLVERDADSTSPSPMALWQNSNRILSDSRFLIRVCGPELHASASSVAGAASTRLLVHCVGTGMFGMWSAHSRLIVRPRDRAVSAGRKDTDVHIVSGPLVCRPAVFAGHAMPSLPPSLDGCCVMESIHVNVRPNMDSFMLDTNAQSQCDRSVAKHQRVGQNLCHASAQGVGCGMLPLFVPMGTSPDDSVLVHQDLTCVSESLLIVSPELTSPLSIQKFLLTADWPDSFLKWASNTQRLPSGVNPSMTTEPCSSDRLEAILQLYFAPDHVVRIMASMQVFVDLGIALTTEARLAAAPRQSQRGLAHITSLLSLLRSVKPESSHHCLVVIASGECLQVDLSKEIAPASVHTVAQCLRRQHPHIPAHIVPMVNLRTNSLPSLRSPADVTIVDTTTAFYNDLQQLRLYMQTYRLKSTTRRQPYSLELLCTEMLAVPDWNRPNIVVFNEHAWDRRPVLMADGSMSTGVLTSRLHLATSLLGKLPDSMRVVPWGGERCLLMETKHRDGMGKRNPAMGRSAFALLRVDADGLITYGHLCPCIQKRSTFMLENMVTFATPRQADKMLSYLR